MTATITTGTGRTYPVEDRLDAEQERRALADSREREVCYACDGVGALVEEDHDEGGYRAWQVGCPECEGRGWVIREPCIACGAPVNIDKPAGEQDHDEGCPVQGEEVRR